jgi:DNA-binding CsgD family transcriptional regulator
MGKHTNRITPRVLECAALVRAHPEGISRNEIAWLMGAHPRTIGAYLWWAQQIEDVVCVGRGDSARWMPRHPPKPMPRVSSIWELGAAL